MSINYPTSLDTLTSGIGASGNPLSSPNHITQHTNESLAIQALEVKVGVDNSAVTTTIDYKLKSTSSVNPGHKHTFTSLSDFNISSPANGDVMQYNSGTSQWKNTPLSNLALRFGGDGSDGALSITTGTTTIDLASAAVVVKNYTSISITGTGKLAFINPATNGTTVVLKSQGNVTLTSSTAPMIDASAIGAGGSGAVSVPGAGVTTNATNGTAGFTFTPWKTSGSVGGTGSGGSANNGTGGVAIAYSYQSTIINSLAAKYPDAFIGGGGSAGNAGGGSGGTASGTTGVGGRGGGCLIIECAGAWNFTTASGISVAGQNGGNGSASGGTNPAAGGGGGGAGGYFRCRYNTLTANSGTVNVSGGSGGTGTNSGGGGSGGGITVGNNGSGANGGAGPSGLSDIAKNTEFA